MTVGEALREGMQALAAASDSPRLDAELLLARICGRSRGSLFAYHDDALDTAQRQAYAELLQRRQARIPVAYLIGEKEFWSLKLAVTPAVLVPRPETELLVEWALELATADAGVLDLGTGSGAIAIALASERPSLQVAASDASTEALAVARGNAQAQRVNVRFVLGDWFEPLQGENFELIVSNPPYIAVDDPHLQQLGAEPLTALTDGADGLSALRIIVAQAGRHLQAGGWLLVEHGHRQGAAVRQLFEQAGFQAIATRSDLAGHERATGGRLT